MSTKRTAKLELLFVDTSISIARLLQGSRLRERIESRTASYRICSSLVSRQEFKRRLLKDARYLLDTLEDRGGFQEAMHYLIALRTHKFLGRRTAICLDLMANITGTDDQDKTDRLHAKLIRLLKTGLTTFDAWFDEISKASGCWCAEQGVTVHQKGKKKTYDFGPEHCGSLSSGRCSVASLLRDRTEDRRKILSYLRSLPAARKTTELMKAEEFLEAVDVDPSNAQSHDPCLKVGDLLIALESAAADAKIIFTMNGKESQHLCQALGQGLVVRPPNPAKEDVVCPASDPNSWPSFG